MRRALCVGIDAYANSPLRGCVSDARRIAVALGTNDDGSPNFDCRVLAATLDGKGDTIDRTTLRKAIHNLMGQPADVALLHFSGHGTENNLGGFLVTQDAKSYDDGVGTTEILQMANQSKAREVVILLDCCHAGHLGQLPALDNKSALLREGVSILAASRADQQSVEADGGGLFTSLVIDALMGGAADILGEITAPAIYSFVETALGAWDQRPLFKSHVAALTPLRMCNPAIDMNILRKLPVYFPVPAEDKPLDPSFEPKSPKPDPAKVAVFGDLQSLSRVHLVVPVGESHMYDAAMQSKACRLTPSGRYYWRLAKDRRI